MPLFQTVNADFVSYIHYLNDLSLAIYFFLICLFLPWLQKQFVQRLEKRYHTMVYDQETDFHEAFRRDHQDNKSDHMKHDKNMPVCCILV